MPDSPRCEFEAHTGATPGKITFPAAWKLSVKTYCSHGRKVTGNADCKKSKAMYICSLLHTAVYIYPAIAHGFQERLVFCLQTADRVAALPVAI